MNRLPPDPDDAVDNDVVWKLVDSIPASRASARFAERTLRAARLDQEAAKPWWKSISLPLPLAGLCAATAAVILIFSQNGDTPDSQSSPKLANTDDSSETFAAVQEAAEIEALLAAVDQLDDFSDHELATLIGF